MRLCGLFHMGYCIGVIRVGRGIRVLGLVGVLGILLRKD